MNEVSNATVWIDVLTPKQAKLFAYLAKRLRRKGMNTIITARDYDYTIATLRIYGEEPYAIVGGYGYDPRSKIVEDARRIEKLLELLPDFDYAISYPNPVVARIAFGLRRRFIVLTDSPHSYIASRLSIPLASAIVMPSCIPIEEISEYILPGTIVVQYDGVDEMEWLKDFEPKDNEIRRLGLEEYRYVVVRPPESYAAYYSKGIEIEKLVLHLVMEILKLDNDVKVVYMPRYGRDSMVGLLVEKCRDRIVVPDPRIGVEASSLLYYAVAAITGGATMAREAALLGTLGISFYPGELHVDSYVVSLGLPLHRVRDIGTVVKMVSEAMRDPERFKSLSRNVRATLSRPSDAVEEVLKDMGM